MMVNTSLPVDNETMRATTARLLGENAELPTVDELNDLVLLYRGHLMLLIPEVEQAAYGRPEDDDFARTGALAGAAEARTRRPVRSSITETVITTALISLVVIAFGTLLITVLAQGS